jgi:hypothetical protein
MRLSLAHVLGAIILIAACEGATNPEPEPPEHYFGVWDLIQVCGGFGGGCMDGDGRFEFERPDRVSVWSGDVLFTTGEFRVREDADPSGHDVIDLKTESDDDFRPWMTVFVSAPDSMMLRDMFADGYGFSLVRE